MLRRALLPAVWLLGVAGLWWLLPPVPRHTWHPPRDSWLVGISPDGLAVVARGDETFLVDFAESSHPNQSVAHGPVEAWDVARDRRLWSYGDPDDRLDVGYNPATGAVLVRRLGTPQAEVRIDSRTGAEKPSAPLVTFDGRTARWYSNTVAFVDLPGPDEHDPKSTAAYSVVTGGLLYTLPPRRIHAVAVSPDSQVLAELQDVPPVLVVREVATGRELSRCADPGSKPECILWPHAVTSDGSRVIGAERRLYDAATGRVVPYQGLSGDDYCESAMLADDGRTVVVVSVSELPGGEQRECRVDWHDTATGRRDPARQQVLTRGKDVFAFAYAPDFRDTAYGRAGRWLWVDVQNDPPPSDFYEWLNRLAPGLFPLVTNNSGTLTHKRGFSRVIDVEAGTVLVDLPPEHNVRGVAADGRVIMTVVFGNTPTLAVWQMPLRPSLRLFAALVAGWTATLAAVRWLGRRRARLGIALAPR